MKLSKSALLQICFMAMLFITASVSAQKLIDKKGKITFEASEETFEPVKASNSSVTAIVNTETNEIAALALMKGFRFKNSLMEEHFNENYIESETYPKAKFRGKLLDFEYSQLGNENTSVVVEGKIELRGKEKPIRTTLSVKKSNGSIIMQGSFKVTPADFDIEIPSIVRKKIANEIIVSLDFKLDAK
ncbi:YceI family protein [Winogradskyella jejuensis]|uniref:YceI-like domain-containing protein n=1 Tax=Winogradskyella jejuensis TaxID=1089305 RepID=A0A1M5MEP4_9FLAO|nr:YceI family protein [Winogradskyella jejuensis]SHG75691.1 YceI-like domain-containing protein [Winogradskyella jejuensis]